jgi:sugar transferase (PEP-CTERM/EpsH1 system associated)
VHTRNLSTIEGQVVAAIVGARARVHGEHGRDMVDLYGKNRKYNLLRKAIRPLVTHFVAVSKDLENWLINTIGAAPPRVDQIYNGVDSRRFYPRNGNGCVVGGAGVRTEVFPEGFIDDNTFVIGSVGRMAEVKNFPSLVQAFLMILKEDPSARRRLRLLIIGEGGTRAKCTDMLREAGAESLGWFPGERADIPELMRAMDLFVLPSLGEGISNTILEAMATGLPVIATRVGGNVELVKEGVTGTLIPPDAPADLMAAILSYYKHPELITSHGAAAREKIQTSFSMEAMTNGYLRVYDSVLCRQS